MNSVLGKLQTPSAAYHGDFFILFPGRASSLQDKSKYKCVVSFVFWMDKLRIAANQLHFKWNLNTYVDQRSSPQHIFVVNA